MNEELKMDNVISEVKKFIEVAEKASDPRTKDWIFVKHISSPLLAICVYVMVVLVGPRIMKSREAFALRKIMAFYNFAAVILSAYIVVKLLDASISENYSYLCEKVDHTFEKPKQVEMARTIWWVYISKYFEMLDTIFFILRKKDNQISFLHVYHHSTVLILWWITIRWLPGGSSFFSGLINSLVHVVMYTYYGLSVFSSLKKYLWWKKYLTQIQMVQFCSLFLNGVLVILSDCGYPHWLAYLLMGYSVTLFLLFGDFYMEAYRKSKEQKKDVMRHDANGNQINQNNNSKKMT